MAADPHQVNYRPQDPFSHSILPVPPQPHNHVLPNPWVPPAPGNPQPDGHREDVPPPVQGVAAPGRVQDFDVAYQGVVDYHPQPLGNPAYVFPNVGFGQGVPPRAQPNAPGYALGHVPQQGPPVHAAFPDPFVHRIPTPNQGGAENLRRIASLYLHHPNADVGVVSMEAGVAGRVKVVIVLESDDFF